VSDGDGRVSKTAIKLTTREELIRAAETLFASQGIDGVSLREINRVARQGNASALQYHFGDRNGLIRAVIDKHRADTDPRRHALLDVYEANGVPDVHALAAALVLPLAAKLSDPDGGRAYLRSTATCTRAPRRSSNSFPGRIRRAASAAGTRCSIHSYPRTSKSCSHGSRHCGSRSSSWRAAPSSRRVATTACSRVISSTS
jgi:AcrR family transcriptional regulator